MTNCSHTPAGALRRFECTGGRQIFGFSRKDSAGGCCSVKGDAWTAPSRANANWQDRSMNNQIRIDLMARRSRRGGGGAAAGKSVERGPWGPVSQTGGRECVKMARQLREEGRAPHRSAPTSAHFPHYPAPCCPRALPTSPARK